VWPAVVAFALILLYFASLKKLAFGHAVGMIQYVGIFSFDINLRIFVH